MSHKKRNYSVGSTVPYEMMNYKWYQQVLEVLGQCIWRYWLVLGGTGSVYDDTGWYLVSISWYCSVLGGTGSAGGLYACIYWKKWRFGRVLPMPDIPLTDRQQNIVLLSLSPV